MKTNFLLFTIGISFIALSFLLSEPAFNGTSPGCGGGGCHSFQDGDVTVTVLDNLQVEVTVSGTSSRVGGELVDVNGTVVDVIEQTSTNPFILSAPFEGTYVVNAGYKSPSRQWDSSLVVISGTVPDFLSVSPTNLTLGSGSGSNGQFTVSSNVNWSVSDDSSWLTVSPGTGSNNGNVTVTATSSNPSTTNSRTGTVTVTGGPTEETVTVVQNPSTTSGFPVDLYGTPKTEKTVTISVSKPGNPPDSASYNITAFDADHGGNDPPEGHAFINGNGPIELFPGATQANGDGQTRDFTFTTPSSWWVDGNNELKFVRLLDTGYRIETASVSFNGSTTLYPQNIASAFANDWYLDYVPERAIDGIIDPNSNSRWAGAIPMPDSIFFDLGSSRTFSKTRISFYEWNFGRIYEYALKVSNDMVNWQTIIASTSSSSSEWSEEIFNPVTGRYILLVSLSNNQSVWAGGWEAEVHGPDQPSDVETEAEIPTDYLLNQNYPNPFNPSKIITYSIPEAGLVTLQVYDILGNEVAQLVDEYKGVGKYSVTFDASSSNGGLSNGIYFYQLKVNNQVSTKKMVLMK